MMNKPIWDLESHDPRDHLGALVIADNPRLKRIQSCRVGDNTSDYVRIVPPIAVDIKMYAMSKLIQDRL